MRSRILSIRITLNYVLLIEPLCMSDDELEETTSVVSKVDNMKKERVCSHVDVKIASIHLLSNRSNGLLFLGF